MKITVFKSTQEDWHPSYEMEDHLFLRVSYIPLNNNTYRVCVWGADDFGMEKDLNSKNNAKELFHKIVELPEISENALKHLGFVYA